MNTSAIGIFGGSFDPVHLGHLRTAWEIKERLQLSEMRLLPCGKPVFKAALKASDEQRVAMLEAAVKGYPELLVDCREISRPGVSYTVDTLTELRSEYPRQPLCLIIGMDAWLSFTQWHRWQDILELAHIVVAHRPGAPVGVSGELSGVMQERQTADVADIHATKSGRIFVHEVTQLDISSSAIRQLIADGLGVDFLVPSDVQQLIINSGCYRDSSE